MTVLLGVGTLLPPAVEGPLVGALLTAVLAVGISVLATVAMGCCVVGAGCLLGVVLLLFVVLVGVIDGWLTVAAGVGVLEVGTLLLLTVGAAL